jgi:branched-chain amino acid transport system permease protein
MVQDLINILVLGSIYTLFAIGMSLAWGTIGILNFAHGAIFMFSAFLGYLIVRDHRLPMIAVLVIGALAGAAMSMIIEAFAFQPIIRHAKTHAAAELQILIGGIGVASIPLALAQKETKSNPFGFDQGSFAVKVYVFGANRISNVQIIILITTLVVSVGIVRWLQVSRTGLALRSIGVDPETAALMGVNRRKLSLGTMAVAGGLAGIAGVLLTYNFSSLAPESGEPLLIKAFAAVVLGGLGSVSGTIAGCFILSLCEVEIQRHTSYGSWVDALSFGLIFIVLLVRPQGLLGKREVRRA